MRALIVLSLCALLGSLPASAKVASIPIDELIEQSNVIVIAKVSSLSTQIVTAHPSRNPKVVLADAVTQRTLKGSIPNNFRFLAQTDFICSETGAVKDELALFFLHRHKNGELDIMAFGNGRMPIGALDGKQYVTDLLNHYVRVYNKANHQLLFTVPRNSTNEASRLSGPTNVAVDQQGRIYVSDSRGFEAKIYDAEGNYLRTIGEQGVTPGQFTLPKGIAADREGRVYVLDAAAPVVQLFDAEGRLLMHFGQPATSGAGALYLPAGMTVDYDNAGLFQKYVAPGFKIEYLILLTNQAGPQKVSVYGFLKKG